MLPKLRWANIGWSYHWGSKSYDFSRPVAPFPKDVKDICQRAVKAVNWPEIWGKSAEDSNLELDEAEWGSEGPDWQSWAEYYGESNHSELNAH